MQRLQFYIICSIFLTPLLSSCQRIDLARNRIIFNDKYEVVQDSLIKMQSLLEKLPRTYRINYFVDAQGYLYVNNTKLGFLKGAINNHRIRKDMSFEVYSDQEFRSFFWLITFLAKNYIDASYFDQTIQKFVFEYRKTEEERYIDLRVIVIDTDSVFKERIKGNYIIIDDRARLKLLAPHDAEIK